MPEIRLITERLYDELISGIRNASGIYIMTSFVMRSGAMLLAPHLKEAAERGAEIHILAGDYLFVTQPEGLVILSSLHHDIDVRLWQSRGLSFHPKSYLFDYENGEGVLIVGSSNMSRSAYHLGMEWNLAMNAGVEPSTFQEALNKFERLFNHEHTIPLNEITLTEYTAEYEEHHRRYPELARDITEQEEQELMLPIGPSDHETSTAVGPSTDGEITPRRAQLLAIEKLEDTLEEGYNRAMVVMATGLGKTYLAAFFAKKFKRVLFIAHREEILFQAKRTFEHVMPDRSNGLYYGKEKEEDASHVFASIFTLGRKKHREAFPPDAFDLIVVDEFHHAAARSYMAVLEHFAPKFLLGLTATPDRMDGKDVYALCDGNVAYQIGFIEAIGHGWLSPFHYYGVYDDTDYSQITWLGTRYDEEQLLTAQLKEDTASKIHNAWLQNKQTRTLAFCSSIKQADFLARFFASIGVSTVSLHSRTSVMSREEAITRLEDGRLDVIFTVDLFNEGVDIPSVDTLLFVRPTESLTVFTQQVGRGLRLHPGKEVCVIIDLIGNYRNADTKLRLFSRADGEGAGERERFVAEAPAGCLIELEQGVINLFEMLAARRQPRKEQLRSSYLELKRELGRRPTYLELHLYGKVDSRGYRQEFKSYAGFLYWAGELGGHEQAVFMAYESWLREVEGTAMAKSYKMVLLLAMLQRGPSEWMKSITPQEVAPFFHRYYMEKEYRKRIDFSDSGTKRLWEYDEARVASLIARMPMTMWSGSSKGLVRYEDGRLWIDLNVGAKQEELLHRWTMEVCEYRLHGYFARREG